MIKRWVTNIVKEYLGTSWQVLTRVMQLDPDKQYMIFVRDDAFAQQLQAAMRTTLDTNRMPRIIIVSAEQVSVMELTPKKQ